MGELSVEKKYEWFISEIGTRKGKKSDYITFVFGCVEEPEVSRVKLVIPESIRGSVVFAFMTKTGYKDKGGTPDPFKHFKRGQKFFAKPVKRYLQGDIDNVRWAIDYDSVTVKQSRGKLTDEKLNKIKRILAHAPTLDEAIRRMATTDQNLLYDFGVAVGDGTLDPDAEVGQGASS